MDQNLFAVAVEYFVNDDNDDDDEVHLYDHHNETWLIGLVLVYPLVNFDDEKLMMQNGDH
jgi:hypothetical protein